MPKSLGGEMVKDPVVQAIREARVEILKGCNSDLGTFFSNLREQEKQHLERIVDKLSCTSE
jgi:hypothetical protein